MTTETLAVKFQPVFYSKIGIGGYWPNNKVDHAFAFDGDSSGSRNHLVFYQPGAKLCTIIKRYQDKFYPVYQSSEGIGGWDLGHYIDRAFAFDFDHSGRMDHIVCYRAGTGGIFILWHDGQGNFSPVYAQSPTEEAGEDGGNGIGGYDLRYSWDRILAYDLDKTKRCDALVLYRRWVSGFCVLRHENGTFKIAYRMFSWGIGGHRTAGEQNYVFAFDWEHTGCSDYLLIIRVNDDSWVPRDHTGVIARQGEKFVTVWRSEGLPTGFTLGWEVIGFPLDLNSSGCSDHFGMFSPESGLVRITTGDSSGGWKNVYESPKGIGICNMPGGLLQDRGFAFDYDGSGLNDHIFIHRRSTGEVWIFRREGHVVRPPLPPLPRGPAPSALMPPVITPPSFDPVFKVDPGGLQSFDLTSTDDHFFSLDFKHSGKLDHLCLYRSGGGLICVAKNDGTGKLVPVFTSSTGIGGYDLKSTNDRAFAIDYDSSGCQDHIYLHRPGSGKAYILAIRGQEFIPVVKYETGLPYYDLSSTADRAIALDFEQTGMKNHVLIYRPGDYRVRIFKAGNGALQLVYLQNWAIGDWQLSSTADRIIAFDYDHKGKQDTLLITRPGAMTVSVLRRGGRGYVSAYHQSIPKWDPNVLAIGGFDLYSAFDRAIPYDYESVGTLNHLCFYRPGDGQFYVVGQAMGGFWPIYRAFAAGLGSYAGYLPTHSSTWESFSSDGPGLGGYDFSSRSDRVVMLDFNSTGCCDHLVAMRPGKGMLWVCKRANGPAPNPYLSFSAQAAAHAPPPTPQKPATTEENPWPTWVPDQAPFEPPPGIF